MREQLSSWHVAIAAEAATAMLFARCGWDVSVQYGANQPEYDLVAVRADAILKVSVKGTQMAGWGLAQAFVRKADYHRAINIWLERHKPHTALCLVQFKNVPLSVMPRVYLATPKEIAKRLHASAGGRGSATLYQKQVWGPRAAGAGTVDEVPDSWLFTPERVAEVYRAA